ncbi:Ger(x)C family spore germination protein [Neobacillus drentensis]|uniref:Ger(x)C family spore germination protein n=1 Tax=Neobacillus drentensis TaxID=220684 RepID=UPI0030001781
MKQRHKNVRLLFRFLSFLLLLTLTGCWSQREIEELGLVVGIALDLEKDKSLEEALERNENRYPDKALMTITNQLITSETTGAGKKEGKSQQKAYNNVSESGDAILPVLRNMVLRSDKHLFAQHLKVIVIGEDLARTVNLNQILDFFLRGQEVRPSSIILIAKNRASKTLESKEPAVIPALHLIQISKGQERTTKILPPISLGKLSGKLHSESSFLLQNVSTKNGEVKFEGASLIDGRAKKLRGFLNEKDLEGITWVTGKGKGGLVKSLDEKTGQLIIYEIESMKSKIRPHVVGNNISFEVNISSEGRIAENWVVSRKVSENEFLKRAEKVSKKEVERLVKNVLDKTQKEYQADVLGFGDRLRIEYPKVWENVKKDWDQTFSKIPIKYNVKLTITDYGTSVLNK